MIKKITFLWAAMLLTLFAYPIGVLADETYTIGWGTASGDAGTFTNFTTVDGSVSGILSFTSAKNDAGSNPAYNQKDSELRLYYNAQGKGGSITITPADGVTITGAVMTTSTSPSVAYSVDGGNATSVTASSNTYTISDISASQSLTIQNVNTSNTQLRIKTIAITYTISGSVSPAISASNVDLAADATEGEIEYSVNNGVDGGVLTASSTANWITPGTVTATTVPFTCEANTETTERTATVTLTYTYGNESVEKNVTVTQAAYIPTVSGYEIDFEYDSSAYTDWTFVNMESKQTGNDVTAHGGTYYGTTGGKATASITTKTKIATPNTLTCFVTKQTGNTTTSNWLIQVSEDGTTWTDVKTQSATSMSKGTWVEFTADLTAHTDVYVRLAYNGSTAIRNIDDLVLTTEPSTDPSISADDVNIAFDATAGEIVYTVENEVTGGSMNVTTTSDWLQITATSFNSPVAFSCEANEGAERTATITLTYSYGDNQTATKNVKVTQAENPNRPGTENNPYSVAEAIQAIDDANKGTINDVYVKGIVSQVDSYSNGAITYWISDDGTTDNQFEVYRGKGIDGANFTSQDDVQVGDNVVVKGNITYYTNGGVYEFTSNNQLVSLDRPASTEPKISIAPASVNAEATGAEGELAISYENLEISGTDDFAVEFCDEEGESLPSNPEWVVAEVALDETGSGYVVTYIVDANTATEERTAYLKVSAIGEEDMVYSNIVTITQAGFAEEVSYKLVKANYELTSGRYLIKATEAAALFDGSLETLDAANNYQVSPSVIEGIIKTDKDIYFTLEKVAGGYTIKSASGQYIGRTSNSNGMNTSDTEAYLNTISFDRNGSALISSNGLNLKFNKNSNQMRFRYFTSEQTSVTLYKEVTENENVLVSIKDGFTATTFSCDKALDFSNVEGLDANIITDANGTTQLVTMVPANTGLYISGEPGDYEIPVADATVETDDVTDNLLEAVLEDAPYVSGGETTYYAYGKNNGTEAFWKIPATAELTVPAKKAVLALPTAQAAKEMIVIGGDVTAIDNLQLTIDNGAIYNLQGQKVNKAQKGVFIQNGRKIVVK